MLVGPLLQDELESDDPEIVPEDVDKIIQNLSVDKAPDIDGVSNGVMRELASCSTSPPAYLFNLYLDSDICPVAWKKEDLFIKVD